MCGGAHFLQVLDFWTFAKCKILLLIVQDKEMNYILASFRGTDLSPPPPPHLRTMLPCALSVGNSSPFSLPSFDACSMQQWMEMVWDHLSCEWPQCLHSWGRTFFMHLFFFLNNEQQPLHFANVQNSNSWIDAARKGFNHALWCQYVYTGRQRVPGVQHSLNEQLIILLWKLLLERMPKYGHCHVPTTFYMASPVA